MKDKKILLYGAGAVGVYFLGRLVDNNIPVTFLARSEYEHVKNAGYQVKSIAGDFSFQPEVLNSVADYDSTADYIFICTKVLSNIDYEKILGKAVGPTTIIVLIQNGIYVEEELKKVFPNQRIISAIAYIGVSRESIGKYLHKGGGQLCFGDYPSGDSKELNDIVSAFKAANVEVSKTADIIKSRWSKLCWNASFNPISVLGNHADTKDIMSDSVTVKLIESIMREVEALSIADGHSIDDNTVINNIDYTRDFPAYKPSMLLDYEHNRPLEIEAIIGNALRVAEKYNVTVPHLQMIYALLRLTVR